MVKIELIMGFMPYCKLIFKLYLIGSIGPPTPVGWFVLIAFQKLLW